MSTAKLGNMRKSFGVKLRDLRGSQSQAAVASVFGIAQQTYAGWEKDQRKPDLTELCSICSHYKVTADWLLGLSEKEPVGSYDGKRIAELEHKLATANEALEHILQATSKLRNAIK